jgi:hypothetical protein
LIAGSATGAARRVLYWYFRTAGAYEFLRRHARPGEAVIIDEGFVHRAVQLHASCVERPAPRQIASYVRSVPRADLTVVVHAPTHICYGGEQQLTTVHHRMTEAEWARAEAASLWP